MPTRPSAARQRVFELDRMRHAHVSHVAVRRARTGRTVRAARRRLSASTSGRAGRVDLVQGGQSWGPPRRRARRRSRGGSRTSAASVRRGALLRETTRLIEFQLGALRAHRGRRFLRPFLSALSRRPDGGAGGALYLHLERVRLTGDVILRTTVTVTTVVTTYTSAPVVTPPRRALACAQARTSGAHHGRRSLGRAPLALRCAREVYRRLVHL